MRLSLLHHMPHDVFVSHAAKDKPIADATCAKLEAAGIRCWIAPRDVQPGRSFAGEITRAIEASKAMVLIFSSQSNVSEQVLREVQLAVHNHLHVVQLRIEDADLSDDLEYFLSTPHWLEAITPPLEAHLERLTCSIQSLLNVPESQKEVTPPLDPAERIVNTRIREPKLASTIPPHRPGARLRWIIAIAAVFTSVLVLFFILTGRTARLNNNGWLTSAEYQRQFDARKSEFYPSNIKGRCHNGREEFRAEWKKLPLASAFESRHVLIKQQFEDRDKALREQGYSPVFTEVFQDCNGVSRYQATWLKTN